jgi:CheY-like chemotaxis protein
MLIRHTVCRFLEERGFTVESATNGVQALEMLGEMSPDIIITDMQMPKMDGSELIDALKAKPETSKIPIVILAGKQTGADHMQETRADYVIFKDIDIETQLQKALVAALGDPAVTVF